MPEEDILYAVNKHFFGGIEPSLCRNIKVTKKVIDIEGDEEAKLLTVEVTFDMPFDTVIEEQVLCTVGGVDIVFNPEHKPKDEFDGYVIRVLKETGKVNGYSARYDATLLGPFDEAGAITGEICYTQLFPFSTNGVYNRSGRQLVTSTDDDDPTPPDIPDEDPTPSPDDIEPSGLPEQYTIGYDLEIDNLSPSARVTYPNDLDNKDFNPVYMDFHADKFNYGSWPSKAGQAFMPKPCLIDDYNGKVIGYLNENNFKEIISINPPYPNVTTVDKLFEADASSLDHTLVGHVRYMMEWPKLYTTRYRTNQNGKRIYHFRCTNKKMSKYPEVVDGQNVYWFPWNNIDHDGNETDYFYISCYPNYGNVRYQTTEETGGLTLNGPLKKYESDDNGIQRTRFRYEVTKVAEFDKHGANNVNYVPNIEELDQIYSYASNIGKGWDIETFSQRSFIYDMLVMMAKTSDLQGAYGKGAVPNIWVRTINSQKSSGGAKAENDDGASLDAMDVVYNRPKGLTFADGLFYAKNSPLLERISATSKTAIDDQQAYVYHGYSKLKVFGMEDYWGGFNHPIAGFMFSNAKTAAASVSGGKARRNFAFFVKAFHNGTKAQGDDTLNGLVMDNEADFSPFDLTTMADGGNKYFWHLSNYANWKVISPPGIENSNTEFGIDRQIPEIPNEYDPALYQISDGIKSWKSQWSAGAYLYDQFDNFWAIIPVALTHSPNIRKRNTEEVNNEKIAATALTYYCDYESMENFPKGNSTSTGYQSYYFSPLIIGCDLYANGDNATSTKSGDTIKMDYALNDSITTKIGPYSYFFRNCAPIEALNNEKGKVTFKLTTSVRQKRYKLMCLCPFISYIPDATDETV